jgi:alkylhydroperoxidase/carboxymuconolactone decarboxylase family protein YurZ
MDSYYNPEDLSKFSSVGEEAPELWKKFSDWYGSVFKEGALSEREKALIGLAVSQRRGIAHPWGADEEDNRKDRDVDERR